MFISKSVVQEIVHDRLGFRKVSARWVPKMLTDDHKARRRSVSEQLLNRYRDDEQSLLEDVITGDETWVHHATPETKLDSMVWKHPSSPVPKKFKVLQSAKKVMATIFWDSHGVLLADFTFIGTDL